MDKLQIIKQTRKIAADTLLIVLKEVLKSDQQISEAEFAQKWLKKLRTHPEIFPSGWYDPPPNGISVLFGEEKDIKRISYKSLRPQPFWPQQNIFLNKNNSIAMFFFSPVNRETGIIGDFGLTAYFGNNQQIKDHLKKSLQTIKALFEQVKVGMSLSEVSSLGHSLLKSQGLYSSLLSPTDPTGTNIGHLIPFSNEDLNSDERQKLDNASKNWEIFKNLISIKRKFLNSQEQLKINPPMAITLEPRPQQANQPEIPMVFFHTIALFYENGKKELLTNFDEIFKLVGMDYMFDY